MSEKDEYRKLAGQFIDLWQKNTAALMNDSEFVRTFLQMMQATSFSAKDNATYGHHSTSSPSAGASAASVHEHASLAGIEERLTALEGRIGALESSFVRIISGIGSLSAESMERPAKRQQTRARSGRRGGKKNS
ncbi:MAG TPA: hypothetical protein VFT64_08810 [Rickettsiales bacterium]|nr:hypothetical protein [Rickettsiales bacterium]